MFTVSPVELVEILDLHKRIFAMRNRVSSLEKKHVDKFGFIGEELESAHSKRGRCQ